MTIYDEIGPGYATGRRADPRIAAAVLTALGDAKTVVNVGAGAGSYEPTDRSVLAVEPSQQMRAQRPPGSPPCVEGVAERLPLADGSVDAALAIYTDFHWSDPDRGLQELRRVCRDRVVVLTVDREAAERYWLTRDYLRGGNEMFRDLAAVTSQLPGAEVTVLPVPHDCSDGFVQAFWRRPAELLDAGVRATMMLFHRLDPEIVRRGLTRLDADLNSGEWLARNHELCGLESLDLGHRLVVWRRGQPTLA